MPGPLTKPRQNTRHVVRIALAAALALIGGALVIVFFVSDRGPVGPLVSCFDFAEEQTGAAESPACAPFILPAGEAARLLESMTLERLDLGFYVVADEDTWAAISKSEIWRTISAAASAVLGVHGVADDVYFIVTPASREESALLLQGDIGILSCCPLVGLRSRDPILLDVAVGYEECRVVETCGDLGLIIQILELGFR